MTHPVSELIKLRPKINEGGEGTEKDRLEVVKWMELVSAVLRTINPHTEFAAAMVTKITQRIDKIAQSDDARKVNLQAEADLVERTIKLIAEVLLRNEMQWEERREQSQTYTNYLQEKEIWRVTQEVKENIRNSDIIRYPFFLLIGAIFIAVLGVINILGQRVDVQELVDNTVDRLQEEITSEGKLAKEKIDKAVDEQLRMLDPKSINERIDSEVKSVVESEGTDIKDRLELRVEEFDRTFPKMRLKEAIQNVDKAADNVQEVNDRIVYLKSQIKPLENGIAEIQKANPNDIGVIASIAQRAEWMVLAGFVGLVLALLHIVSQLVSRARKWFRE